MYKKFLFLTSFVLVLSLAYNSYGTDTTAPKPSPLTWRYVPATLGPSSITMTATTALDNIVPPDDTNSPPVEYYFECTNHGEANSPSWQTSPTYEATGLAPNTVYSFKARARDNGGRMTSYSITLSATTDYSTTPPALRLDLNNTEDNNDANTQTGFTPFIITDSGKEVCGVIIDLSGNLNSKREDDPCGSWEWAGQTYDPCWWSPRAGERIYRDYIFGFGSSPTGVTITLWGLGTNRDCNITIWGYDSKSTGESNRVALWSANGTHICDTNFMGGSAGWPRYDNVPGGAVDLYKYAFSGRGTTDDYGRIILTSTRGPYSPTAEPFAFVNAIKVEPNSLISFAKTKYAHRPQPIDGQEDVLVNTLLKWRNGDGVVKHDFYLGDACSVVYNATRASHPGVLVYAPDLAANVNAGYDPCGGDTDFLGLDKTYYWRVDENDNPPLYTGLEVWSFTTCPNSVVENFDEYTGDDLYDVWYDHWTQDPVTGSTVYLWRGIDDANLVRGGKASNSLKFQYDNSASPYYSEAYADIVDLGIDPDWLGMNAKSLVLWFQGQINGISAPKTNDANEQMYVTLTDGASHSGTVNYPPGKMNDIRNTLWYEWNIDLALFSASGVDLSDVSRITIGFGDKVAGPGLGTGVVYFEDIQVYATRCALRARSDDFAKLDYAPSAILSGDCVIDYREIQMMATAWLDRDAVVDTNRPGDANLVVYYSLNEGDGNKVYSHPVSLDVCDTKWTGTFWNNGVTTPGIFGTTWASPSYDGNNSPDFNHCVRLTGEQGSRIQCGEPNSLIGYSHLNLGIGSGKVYPTDVNAITLSVWVKWLGKRGEPYLDSKSQGILGKRGGWDDSSLVWMLECDTGGGGSSFGLRHYAVGDTATPDVYTANNILNPYIGQWVHLAATFPHPAANPATDGNSHAWLYLNGGQVGNGPWRFSNGYDANIYLTIGETMDQNAWPSCPESFYGYIDEVRIYNRALEPNEIGYLADMTPSDWLLWIPIPSPTEVYSSEAQGSKVVNFKDFALLVNIVNGWLKEEMFPR